MSYYVRWGEDSDVYCYQHPSGYWAIHVGKETGGAEVSPHNGVTFKEPDMKACSQRLAELKGAGYRVPEQAFVDLQAETLSIQR